MKVIFTYDRKKDIWCLLNKGKTSINSQNPTKQYEEFLVFSSGDLKEERAGEFIDSYLQKSGIDIAAFIETYQRSWERVSDQFQLRAEKVFGVSLPYDVLAYLSINSRSPYNISEHYFFVGVPTQSIIKTVMHELWHFYTWEKFGLKLERRIGKEKYNDMKEALTVLLNVECRDLLPDKIEDRGYPQHQELRVKILELWKEKNLDDLIQKIL